MRPSESFVGQSVRSLQTMLRVLAEDDASLPSVIPDGFYGNQTRDAVAAFQHNRSIPVTGVTNQQTWDRIRMDYEPAFIRISPAQPLQLILNPGQVIRQGEAHPYLFLVQAMLNSLSDIYSSIGSVEMTGVLDLLTSQALRDFQYLAQLEQTGQLDKITWKHLALHYPLAVNLNMSQNRISR